MSGKSSIGALFCVPDYVFIQHSSLCVSIWVSMTAGDCKLMPYSLDNGKQSPFPLMQCRNVYVLPGVPDLLRQKWKVM